MSKIDIEKELDNVLNDKGRVFVLFYSSWCPFCERFLPIFEKFAEDKTRNCLFVEIDDNESLSEKYFIDVVPTIILFEKGKISKRLDGVQGKGLTENQLIDFVNMCQEIE